MLVFALLVSAPTGLSTQICVLSAAYMPFSMRYLNLNVLLFSVTTLISRIPEPCSATVLLFTYFRPLLNSRKSPSVSNAATSIFNMTAAGFLSKISRSSGRRK